MMDKVFMAVLYPHQKHQLCPVSGRGETLLRWARSGQLGGTAWLQRALLRGTTTRSSYTATQPLGCWLDAAAVRPPRSARSLRVAVVLGAANARGASVMGERRLARQARPELWYSESGVESHQLAAA